MNITVPIYVEEQAPQATGVTHARPVSLRPLFFDQPREQDESLQRATARLARELRRELTLLARAARHEEFAAYSFYPPLEDRILKLTLEIGNRRFQVRHLFVILPAFGRRFAWTPSVPEVWFELTRGETLEERAREALSEHYRLLERQHGSEAIRPDAATIGGKAWLTSLEVSIDVPSVYTPPVENIFAILGGGETPDGAAELERVGRSLGALYPDELERATNREEEVAEVTRLLGASDKRPVLLVGKRLVGKTAIIHEYVRRRMERRRSSETTMHIGARGGVADLAGDVWLIAPQRLISGMSYVGQWEGRLLAILKEAERKRHTLYFDDLIGLFYAGHSSASNLSVAHVLKPYIERRDVRVVAEATHEALRVLQELDRSFADLFQIVPIKEPTEAENLRTLLGYRRALEQQHRCRFHAEVLPTAIDLTRRYAADAAFPGKAAALLQTLATKHKEQDITREDALTEFSAKSGLSIRFLDDRAQLNHAEVIETLSREVVGQRAAVAACADAVTIAKARLNDPGRPIASFLFLGPTGVGKTQCAKSLAKYLFGDSERILRFDMNEFASQYSVARLTGTFDAPEGLLTSAVRREPFAVVLFDEIEKAHPAVFDLLLGVMGDARLTDARGQTVDFTNTIIILTSNLGAREAASELGFRQTNRSDASIYRQAAEKFFKPEFFNRLTRVVPFERLRREDVRGIARRLIEGVLNRDGLVRRGVKLIIEADALNLLVEAGYHPQLGARALKRTLERQVTAPIAAELSATTPDQPLIISLRAHQESIAVEVHRIKIIGQDAAPLMQVPLADADELLDRVEDALARIEEGAAEMHSPGEIIIGGSGVNVAAQLQHFLIREQARRVSRMLGRADERLSRQGQASTSGGARNTRLTSRQTTRGGSRTASSGSRSNKRQLAKLAAPPETAARTGITPLSSILAAQNAMPAQQRDLPIIDDTRLGQNLYRFLQDCVTHSTPYGDHINDYLQDLLREIALLDALWTTVTSGSNTEPHGWRRTTVGPHRETEATLHAAGLPAHTLLTIASLDEQGRAGCVRLRDLYRALFEREFGCHIALPDNSVSARLRAGVNSHQHVEALILEGSLAGLLAPLEAGTHLFVSASESYTPIIVSSRAFDSSITRAPIGEETIGLPPVLRIYSEPGPTLDLRSHLLATAKLSQAELRAFILTALPPPREFD